jgi:hypothetical protein
MILCALGEMAIAADRDCHGSLNSLKVAAGLNSERHGQFAYTSFVRLFTQEFDCNTSAECHGIIGRLVSIQLILDISAGGQ